MAVGTSNKTEKTSFVLYTDSKELWGSLSNEQAGKLIKHIYNYVAGDNSEPPDEITRLLFCQIKATLDRDQKKWLAVRDSRSDSGKKGGRPLKAKKANGFEEKQTKTNKASGFDDKQIKANKAVSVNANATVNENEVVDDKLYDIDDLHQKYLANDKLVKAVKEKTKFDGGLSLEKRLVEFNMFLKAKDQFKKTWKDYTSHFLNWHEKSKKSNISDARTFNTPVI